MAPRPERRQQDALRIAADQSISEAAKGTRTRSRASRAREAGARVQGRSRARARSAGQCREAGLCTEERHSAEPLELASQIEPASTRSGSADKVDRHRRPTPRLDLGPGSAYATGAHAGRRCPRPGYKGKTFLVV